MVVRPIHFDAALRPSSTGFGLSSQIQFQSLSSPLSPATNPTLSRHKKITHHFPNTLSSCASKSLPGIPPYLQTSELEQPSSSK